MENLLKYSVGIDISKETFDSCFSSINEKQQVKIKSTRKMSNSPSGIKNLLSWVKKHKKQDIPIVFTMEATGVYYEKAALALFNEGYYVSVVLPNRSKKYIESIGYKTKNDKIDSKGLAQMGAEQNLDNWVPYSKDIYQLRMLTRQNEDLQKQRTAVVNRLESQKHCQQESKMVCRQLKTMLRLIDKQIDQVKQAVEECVEKDEAMKSKVDKIVKIKGLGILTVATTIAETNGFHLFKNQRQLVSFVGYDVVENQSGKRIGKTKISKKGNSHIRRAMHMPALNVVRYDQSNFKALYERVYEKTGMKMKGYTAVQRKLLILIYTLWKKDEEYNDNYSKTSKNDKSKDILMNGSEEENKVPEESGTQDELLFNESSEVLFYEE